MKPAAAIVAALIAAQAALGACGDSPPGAQNRGPAAPPPAPPRAAHGPTATTAPGTGRSAACARPRRGCRKPLTSDPTQYTYPVYEVSRDTPRAPVRYDLWYSRVIDGTAFNEGRATWIMRPTNMRKPNRACA